MYSPIMPECQEVPHAVIITRSNCFSSSSVRFNPVTRAVPSSSSKWPRSVFLMLSGCSQISLSQVPVNLIHLFADACGNEVAHPVAVTGEHRHFAVIQINDGPCVLEER